MKRKNLKYLVFILISIFSLNTIFANDTDNWTDITSVSSSDQTKYILNSIITWSYTWTINHNYSWSILLSSDINITSYIEEEKRKTTEILKDLYDKDFQYFLTYIINIIMTIYIFYISLQFWFIVWFNLLTNKNKND